MTLQIILSYVLLIVISLLSIFYFYFTNTYDYWKKKNVKFVKPIPFFGNYYESATGQKHTSQEVTEKMQQFPNERVVGLFQGRRPALFIRDPELIKDVLLKDFWHFCNRRENMEKYGIEEMGDMNMFGVDGDKWKALRNSYSPLFTISNLKKMTDLIVLACSHFEKYIDDRLRKNNEIDAHSIMARLTMEIIGSTVFGLQVNTISDDLNQFRAIGHKIFTMNKKSIFKNFFRNASPEVYSFFKTKTSDQVVNNFFFDLSKKMVEMRKQEGKERHDFVDTSVKLLDKGILEGEVPDMKGGSTIVTLPVTHEVLSSQSMVFYGAGFETSATAMTLTLYELAKNIEIQRKAQKEIDDVLTRSGGKLSYDVVFEMKYLEMCMNETMRLYPAIGAIFRICTEKYTFKELDLTIDPGVLVLIGAYEMHHDPKYFPNPEEYKPERFSPENIDKIHAYTYLPFGEGPRICIGLRLGKIQTIMGLITILKKYNIEKTDKTPNKIEFSPNSVVAAIPGNIVYLRLSPRQ